MASTESFENLWKMSVYGKVPNQKNMWNFCILRSVSCIFSYIEGNYMMYFRYMRYGEEIDECFSKCDHLLKKYLMENLSFCAVLTNSTTSSDSTLLTEKKNWRKSGFNWDSCNCDRKVFNYLLYRWSNETLQSWIWKWRKNAVLLLSRLENVSVSMQTFLRIL